MLATECGWRRKIQYLVEVALEIATNEWSQSQAQAHTGRRGGARRPGRRSSKRAWPANEKIWREKRYGAAGAKRFGGKKDTAWPARERYGGKKDTEWPAADDADASCIMLAIIVPLEQ